MRTKFSRKEAKGQGKEEDATDNDPGGGGGEDNNGNLI